MSKIGKIPIDIPSGVSVAMEGRTVQISGHRGMLQLNLPNEISLETREDRIYLSLFAKSPDIIGDESGGRRYPERKLVRDSSKKKNNPSAKALYGTYRSLIANCVKGVSEGWGKKLEMVGTGYRAELQGKNISLNIGYSHPVVIEAPEGIEFKVEKSIITVEGRDKQLVGQMAANIRSVRPPEPYKGKGIKYIDEYIRRKAGKATKTAA